METIETHKVVTWLCNQDMTGSAKKFINIFGDKENVEYSGVHCFFEMVYGEGADFIFKNMHLTISTHFDFNSQLN